MKAFIAFPFLKKGNPNHILSSSSVEVTYLERYALGGPARLTRATHGRA